MATSANTVQERIRTARRDTIANARAAITHADRLDKSVEAFKSNAVDLETFSNSRKAVLDESERSFVVALVELADADELDVDKLKALLATLAPAEPEPAAAEVEAAAAGAAVEQADEPAPTSTRKPRRQRETADA